MTWESSLIYERLLNEGTRKCLGGAHSADLVVRSYDFQRLADSMAADDWQGLGDRIAEDVDIPCLDSLVLHVEAALDFSIEQRQRDPEPTRGRSARARMSGA